MSSDVLKISARNADPFEGQLRVPSDKSITQRALLFGAVARGTTHVASPLRSADSLAVLSVIQELGATVTKYPDGWEIEGVGEQGLRTPSRPLDLQNSGTGVRLLMGLLAGQGVRATLTGDDSLQRRPMQRVLAPLASMGVTIESHREWRLPVTLLSRLPLSPFHGQTSVASAQVKSAILLAALGARGLSVLEEPRRTRDHTEIMLRRFGVPVHQAGPRVEVSGPASLQGCPVTCPADPSSAAPFATLAALRPGSRLRFSDLLVNPRRFAFFEALARMGVAIRQEHTRDEQGEPLADVVVEGGPLQGTTIVPEEVPDMIDELPLVAVLGCFAEGVTEVRGAAELRVKESDRLEAIAGGLRALGAVVELFDDGFRIEGPQALRGNSLSARDDHRIAMALSLAALHAEGTSHLEGSQSVQVSYPGFFEQLDRFQIAKLDYA